MKLVRRNRAKFGFHRKVRCLVSIAAGLVLFAIPALPEDSPTPENVKVGLYWNSVTNLDLRTNSYVADFYLWFLWRGQNDPTRTFEFTNLIESWNLVKTAAYFNDSGAPEPQTLPDGSRYQQYHVQGRFSQPFSLERFPVDEQDLVVSIEDLTYDEHEMQYVVDHKDSAANPRLIVPGWRIGKFTGAEGARTYASRFGDPRLSRILPYSHLTFGIHIARPVAGLLCKTVLPISIIIVITFAAFFCRPESLDTRLTLAITALIAAVALWYSTDIELPPSSYLLLIDKVYLLSFFAILFTTFCSIVSNRVAQRGKHDVAERIDHVVLACLTCTYFGGIGALLLL
jgi:branched-chain amino acid transport system substrate-binding protein